MVAKTATAAAPIRGWNCATPTNEFETMTWEQLRLLILLRQAGIQVLSTGDKSRRLASRQEIARIKSPIKRPALTHS